MKLALASLLLAASAAPALAQTTPPAAAPATAATPATEAALTIDTPIEQLEANPQAAAVLEKHLPGIAKHEAYDTFKSMSLKQVAPYSDGKVSDEVLKAIAADLATIR